MRALTTPSLDKLCSINYSLKFVYQNVLDKPDIQASETRHSLLPIHTNLQSITVGLESVAQRNFKTCAFILINMICECGNGLETMVRVLDTA